MWLLFFVAALLYASVGHGGASSYLALMVWFGWPMDGIRSQALMLNLVVSLTGTLLFFQAGAFRSKLFVPLVVASIPLAWHGGSMRLPSGVYEKVLAVVLVLAAVLLIVKPRLATTTQPKLPALFLVGGCIGWVSGLIGIGGGIFLTPILILAGWATPKEAAALSAPFIFVNSASGMLGLVHGGYTNVGLAWGLIPAVVLGGLLGAYWGSHRARPPQLRYALSIVLLVASSKLFVS